MDRYYLERPEVIAPDEATEDEKLIAETGEQHEQAVLKEFQSSAIELIEIPKHAFGVASAHTLSAIQAKVPVTRVAEQPIRRRQPLSVRFPE